MPQLEALREPSTFCEKLKIAKGGSQGTTEKASYRGSLVSIRIIKEGLVHSLGRCSEEQGFGSRPAT